MGEVKKPYLATFEAIRKYKSIGRAITRGHVTSWGEEIPRRPFNNRKRTLSREFQNIKEQIYEQLKHRNQTSRA